MSLEHILPSSDLFKENDLKPWWEKVSFSCNLILIATSLYFFTHSDDDSFVCVESEFENSTISRFKDYHLEYVNQVCFMQPSLNYFRNFWWLNVVYAVLMYLYNCYLEFFPHVVNAARSYKWVKDSNNTNKRKKQGILGEMEKSHVFVRTYRIRSIICLIASISYCATMITFVNNHKEEETEGVFTCTAFKDVTFDCVLQNSERLGIISYINITMGFVLVLCATRTLLLCKVCLSMNDRELLDRLYKLAGQAKHLIETPPEEQSNSSSLHVDGSDDVPLLG